MSFLQGADCESALPVGDSSFGEIVRGEFHGDLVSGEDADEVHAHLS